VLLEQRRNQALTGGKISFKRFATKPWFHPDDDASASRSVKSAESL
jgi:hypothetical protein